MVNLCRLGFRGFVKGFFEKPMYDFLQVVNRHHSSKLLSFEKIAFSAFWRQTDGQTDRQTDNAKAVAMIDETSGIDPQRF